MGQIKDLQQLYQQVMSEGKTLSEFIKHVANQDDVEHPELPFYKTMFLTLIDQSPVGIYILGGNYFTYVNAHLASLLGYSKEELTDKSISLDKIIHVEDYIEVKKNIVKRTSGYTEPSRYKLRLMKKDGRFIYAEVHTSASKINGEITMFGTVIDMTVTVSAEIRLQETMEKYESLFYNSPDAIFTLDEKGMLIDVNPASESLTGYSKDEILKMSLDSFVIAEDLPHTISQFEKAMIGISSNSEVGIKRKDGRTIYINGTHFPMKVNGQITGVYGIAKDITRKKLLDAQLEQLAFYDPLTSLPNRKLFEDRLSQLIKLSIDGRQQFAVLMIDVNRFKLINDSFNHQIGDEFLIQFALRLKQTIRKTDTISRLAGDQFTILLPDISKEKVVQLAALINEDIKRNTFNIEGHLIKVTVCIGIAFNNGEDTSASELIRNADTAIYHTKKSKRNGYTIYSEELDLKAAQKRMIEQDLQNAIRNNEFELYYQPIKDLKTNKLMSVEALIRWHHPKMGLISPDLFIPVAEESGQIISLGEWVLQTACTQLKKWQELDVFNIKISVNISTKQLMQDNFVSIVLDTIEKASIDAKWLELEVTESILLEDIELIKGSLIKLKEAGITISIDDFGTGYTSLNYLREFPFDKVKIDRSFIGDINSDLNGKRITSAIISLAHSLNMLVIAEGIEDEVQLNYLKSEGCDAGQGYYFSRPLPTNLLALD